MLSRASGGIGRAAALGYAAEAAAQRPTGEVLKVGNPEIR